MTESATKAMPLAFVPMFSPPRRGAASARVGWIVAENGCHIWQGSLCRGYGKVWLDGRHRKAHRVRYEREVGPIPDGMPLDHFVCENPQCCNPEHVRPATHRENILRADGIPAQHAAKMHCPEGHPYEGDNLYVNPLHGGRVCRECKRTNNRAQRARMSGR